MLCYSLLERRAGCVRATLHKLFIDALAPRTTDTGQASYLRQLCALAVIPLSLLAFALINSMAVSAADAAVEHITENMHEGDNWRPRILHLNDAFETYFEGYGGFNDQVDLSAFLIQDQVEADWTNQVVHLVFADRERFFVILRETESLRETSLSNSRDFGSHYVLEGN